jgi:methanethiol S-methyltransferase
MNYAADVLVIILAFAIFGYTHSLLASKKLKRMAAEKFGSLMAFYRLIYNFVSLISFYILYIILPRPDLQIYDLPNPWDLLILIPQFLSLAGIIWSARYFSLWEFAGIAQVRRWLNGSYNPAELDERFTFRAEGPYKFSRHPVYFFSIMFLLLRPEMNLFYLTFFLCITAYFYIGSVYEEKKLTADLGDSYIEYKDRVPRIFPIKFKIR